MLYSLIFYVPCAFLLFILNRVIGNYLYKNASIELPYSKFSFKRVNDNFAGNFFLKTVNPALFIAIVCALLQHYDHIKLCYYAWIILPLYWIIRIISLLLSMHHIVINLKYEIVSFLASVIFNYVTYSKMIMPLIEQNESVFITLPEFRAAVWYGIIAYLFVTFWKTSKAIFDSYNIYPVGKIDAIIISRYNKFAKKYGDIIKRQIINYYPNGNRNFELLVYSIMIYEDYNRPFLIRGAETIVKLIRKNKKMTLGIMQVATDHIISNQKSIEMGIDLLASVYCENEFEDEEQKIIAAVSRYNCGTDYYDQVNLNSRV